MIATNHVLAGSVIGATFSLGYAIPAALLSHVLMDMLPHYGIEQSTRDGSKWYRRVILYDTSAAISISYVSIMFGEWQMFWIGWLAFSPDFAWVFIHFKKGGTFNIKTENWLARLHHKIQLFERPWGIYVDMVIAIALFATFVNIIVQ